MDVITENVKDRTAPQRTKQISLLTSVSVLSKLLPQYNVSADSYRHKHIVVYRAVTMQRQRD
jgi:hypothetical protein